MPDTVFHIWRIPYAGLVADAMRDAAENFVEIADLQKKPVNRSPYDQ
jgi:hypothetical protein